MTFLQNVAYHLLYASVWTLAWLPLRIGYLFSDLIFLLLYHVVRYRRSVVRRNLAESFPDRSPRERRRIERRFYRHLTDVFAETLHLLHTSEREMRRRMQFVNIEVMEDYLRAGRNVILMLGHYGNWEYMVGVSLWLTHRDFVPAGIYRRLKNPVADRFYLNLRTLFGITAIEKNALFREIIRYRRSGTPLSFAIMADQTPSPRNIHYWTEFLHHDTPFLNGGERIARQTDYVLIYTDIRKVSRGHYRATLSLIDDDVPHSPEFRDTERYARLMEQTILRDPAYWLWSHKRWKHRREDFS